MGALMTTSSGVPISLGVFGEGSQNTQGRDNTFLNGLTTLGDILKARGYKQEFLCGSDITFSHRDVYYEVHGNYKIFDFNTALNEGYATEHNGWWGIDDYTLFKIARDELTELAKGDKPFNFTMLTVDPHHNGGYICSHCGNDYSDRTANVITCQDKLVADFIEWCKQQDFYENTTIVITGDHPRMDRPTAIIDKSLGYYERTMYNCILNPATDVKGEKTNRAFTSMDIFPTTLAAMGFEIEGDRLGLGTNLFSEMPTLWEELGGDRASYDWLERQIQKDSTYYRENFVNETK